MPTDRTLESPLTAPGPGNAARPLGRFLGGVLAVCALVGGLVGLSFAVLRGNLENVSPIEAARMQMAAGGGLYGSALVYRPYPYKLELFRLQKPDVAIVGSSRAMAFVADGFAGSMTNLGGAVNEIADARDLIPEMLAARPPKLLLITLDFWWFNSSRFAEADVIGRSPDITLTLNDILTPFAWLADGDVKPAALLGTLFAGRSKVPLIGAWARLNHSGFDLHGARFYGAQLTGEVAFDDPGFKATLKRLKKGTANGKLAVAEPFSEEAWAELMKVADKARQAGVEVRFIVPPLAPPVMAAIRASAPHTLIDDLRDHLAHSGFAYLDASDPAALGSGSCEFVDGLHGGFVTYLRILRRVADGLAERPELRALIQPDSALDGLIGRNADRATLHGQEFAGDETDFLELGCDKSSPQRSATRSARLRAPHDRFGALEVRQGVDIQCGFGLHAIAADATVVERSFPQQAAADHIDRAVLDQGRR